ncbi:hypothetical protein UFOVP722_24 [uncultured Caudovirales phage]|jgi:hypothetical protein|uniref:Gp6 domain containing protein n=1 Tax=uncultured Caudovirales phage TaxID=2100421 RepID=A0A6J5NMJ8_9CAUD|nr:hypothetical protein UFOVP722_24 [uncultured Caudovirales phage]
MALITLSELKSVLGIGDIYADSIVQAVADSAENIILSYLIFDDVSIVGASLTNNVARFYCHDNTFVVGQALTVTGCGSPFNGSRTVTKVGYDEYNVTYFEAAITNADISKRQIIPNGRAVLTSQAALYDTTPEVREAALAVACDIWITRTGTLGQQGVDFQSPAPYRLGRSMLTRVSGLLGKHLDTRGYLG